MVLNHDYKDIELIARNEYMEVLKAINISTGNTIILKTIKKVNPTISEISKLKYEYNITQKIDSKGIVKALDFKKNSSGYFIEKEYFKGISLKNYLEREKSFNIYDFLEVAIQLAETIGEIHENNIIHMDINPSNILINPKTKQVKITDFSIASTLVSEALPQSDYTNIEGTPSYFSPEQTGRMNRCIDFRSDLYSLGITLYEMITGELPFKTHDLLEIVHCHLSMVAEKPSEKNIKIPNSISSIIMKLIEKDADNRYQSAMGLHYDLNYCLKEFSRNRTINDFTLAKKDHLSQLYIPQKIYGRDPEISTLLNVFDSVIGFQSKILFVSGFSGIGKTSIINEIQKNIISKKGIYICGKYDKLQKNVPYSAFIQGFRAFLQTLLTEDSEKLKYWQFALTKNLDNYGQIIISQLPELELIIGPQPDVPLLESSNSQNRFRKVFQSFINTFAQESHPLVLFLDDLQWADLASIQLIENFLSFSAQKNLLLIGAYRENEVVDEQPLHHFISKSYEQNYFGGHIHLESLSKKATRELIHDTFKTEGQNLDDLVNILHIKSLGNPFYIKQILKSLFQEKIVFYDFKKSHWSWDINQVHSIKYLDNNIIDIIIRNLKILPKETVEIIKLASCLGNQFSHSLLSIVSNTSASKTAEVLWPALQSGYVIPLNNLYRIPLSISYDVDNNLFDESTNVKYQFAHDKIQQAAYSLFSVSSLEKIHLDIGRKIFSTLDKNAQNKFIFEIVNQYNFGLSLLDSDLERDQLCRLNISAGIKSKNSAAFVAANKYFDFAIKLTSDDSWLYNYNFTIKLYLLALEASYMAINYNHAQKLFSNIKNNARNKQDIVQAYEFQISFHFTQNQPNKAIDIAFEALNILGIQLPRNPKKINIFLSILRVKFFQRKRTIKDLIQLPIIKNSKQLAAMRILMSMIPATFVAQPLLYPVSVSKMVEISLIYGNSPFSIFAYNCYGLVFCGAFNQSIIGFKFGQLALSLQDLFNKKEYKSKTIFVFYVFISPWVNHLQNSIDILPEGVDVGIETGDIEYASHCASFYSIFYLLCGNSLSKVFLEHEIYSKLLSSNKQEFQLLHLNIWRQFVDNLISGYNYQSEIPVFCGRYFNEISEYHNLLDTNNDLVKSAFYLSKSLLSFIFNSYTESLEYSILATKHIREVPGVIYLPISNFLNSLSLMLIHSKSSKSKRKEIIHKIKKHQNELFLWADKSPDNFLNLYYLVEAQLSVFKNDSDQVIKLFEKAIHLSSKHGYTNIQAIATELYSLYFSKQNMTKVSELYILEAYYLYEKWGAHTKTDKMRDDFPCISEKSIKNQLSCSYSFSDSVSTTRQLDLDLTSVFKTTQAISEEIVLSKLLITIMELLTENAGAQVGILILNRENELLEVVATGFDNDISFTNALPITQANNISKYAVNYVSRTHQPVILGDALNDATYSKDAYIVMNKVKSLLCLPMIKQGMLLGLAYFENNLACDSFRKDQLEVMSILCSQAAISLENAYLYADLQQSQAREQAERDINELKSRFISMTSHEFRTPLTAILGTTELIKHYGQGWDTTKQHSYLDRIQKNVKHMTGLLDDVLVLSKADVGKVDFNPQKINLEEFCGNLVEELQLNTKQEQEIEYAIEGKNFEAYADEKILRQILSNLLTNAIKYSSKNTTVRLDVLVTDEEATFYIKDQGIGIPEADQQHLFESFHRATNVGQIQGTGLGLAIVKKSVELHKGTITFESVADQGTTFIVNLPIAAEVVE